MSLLSSPRTCPDRPTSRLHPRNGRGQGRFILLGVAGLVSLLGYRAARGLADLRLDTIGFEVAFLATFALYLGSLSVGLLKFHQLGNLHLYSSKVAGGALYSFAVITLLTGSYEPLLLWLAAAAFMVSSAETLLAQLAGAFAAPLATTAGLFDAPLRDIVGLVSALADQRAAV